MAVNGRIIVKKYGGTSVANPEMIRRVAGGLRQDQAAGWKQVVVVSAMAQTTDQLIALAKEVTGQPRARELDLLLTTGEQVSSALLAMALHEVGSRAIALTGAQCGIRTDRNFTRARIRGINSDRLRRHLDQGEIVIVAGFQGITHDHEITTLGRGGSDTTGTALAAALDSCRCQILTDVDGVFTADPRVVPEARLLDWISYGEMLEYAGAGSRILHARCVEMAARFDIPLEVCSSFNDRKGTHVTGEEKLESVTITGVTGDPGVARVGLRMVKDTPGVAAMITGQLADKGINVLFIIQGSCRRERQDMSLIIEQGRLEETSRILHDLASVVDAEGVIEDSDVAIVAIIGSGIADTPGVASRMFQALADEGINIEQISSSEVRLLCVIDEARLNDAVRAIHREFELHDLERRPVQDDNRQKEGN